MKTLVWILLAIAVGTAGVNRALAQGGKIPVTTASPEARELYLRGRMLFEKFKNPEARVLLQQAVAKDPEFALAYRDLAFTQPSFKEFNESMAKAVALVDKVSPCEKNWILSDDASGKFDFPKQREYLVKLAADCGQDEHTQYALGVYYFGRQYYDSAAAALQKATEYGPGYVAAWNMLGYARRSLQDYPGAEQAFQKYIDLSPTDANAYDSYGELLLKEGKFADAVTQYRQALKVDPAFNLSRFNMAAPLTYLGRYDEARKELQDMLDQAADDGQRQTAYFGMAMTYADEDKLNECVATLEKSNAISEKINDASAMTQNIATFGFLRLEQGQFDAALTDYERSLAVARAGHVAPNLLALAERNMFYVKARIAALKGQVPKANAFVDSFAVKANATKTVNDQRLLHELRGIVALEAKQYQTAVAELKQGPTQNGYDHYRLALAYQGLGDKAKAREQIAAAAHMNTVLNLNDLLKRKAALQLEQEWGKE